MKNFHRSDYGGGRQNWGLTQSASGEVFIANNEGLLEFDGSEWTLHPTFNKTNARTAFYDPADNCVLVGASNEIDRLGASPADGGRTVRLRSMLDSLGVTLMEIWRIYRMDESYVLQGNNALYKVPADFSEIETFDLGHKIECSEMIGGKVYAFARGIGMLSFDGEWTQMLLNAPAFGERLVKAIIPWEGNILLMGDTPGLWRYDGRGIEPCLTQLTDEITGTNLFCAATDGKRIALGTVSAGVWIAEPGSGTLTHIDTGSGLQNNTVLSMMFDTGGRLWLGLDDGIDCIDMASAEEQLFSPNDNIGAGYASALFNGKLYLGTNQGLYRTDMEHGVEASSQVTWQVWSLQVFDGQLFCCHNNGLSIIAPDGTVTTVPMNGAWKLEPLAGRPDLLLGCSYDRLFTMRRQGGRWGFGGFVKGFDEASKAFTEDTDGRIWFSHHIKGLYRLTLDAAADSVTLVETFAVEEGFPTGANNVPVWFKGRLVFATEAGYYDFSDGRATPDAEMNAMFSSPPYVLSVTQTAEGQFYFSSDRMQAIGYADAAGHVLVDSMSLRTLAGRRIQGFDCLTVLEDGRILVNTADGFSLIRPYAAAPEDTAATGPHPVFIKAVYATDSPSDFLLLSSIGGEAAPLSMTLQYRQNSVRFEFVRPGFNFDAANEYSVCLEGYDKDWTAFSEAGSKEYTKLPPGRYVLRVRAKDVLSGDMGQTSMEVTVTPPWYATKGMKIVYAVLTVIAIFLIVKLFQYLTKRRADILAKRMDEERKRRQMIGDLKGKADDLAASTMNLIRKNEVLHEIDESLVKMRQRMLSTEEGRKGLAEIDGMRDSIRANIAHDGDWLKFRQNFDLVYDDFLSRLEKACPKLNITDKKICAYLKIGMSSKEMSSLMNMSVHSVEMTRHRLRQKLGLAKGDNLSDFLQKF